MACVPDHTKFYSGERLKLNKSVCNDLLASCYNYVMWNEEMSFLDNNDLVEEKLAKAEENVKKVREASAAVANKTNLKKDDPELGNLVRAFVASANASFNRVAKVSTAPTNCNETNCTELCSRFINRYGVNMSYALNPGKIETVNDTANASSNSSARLLQEIVTESVVYADDGFDPDDAESGLEDDVSVEVDPANINGDIAYADYNSGAVRIAMVGLVSTLFLIGLMLMN
jgi:hypothetical protein